MKIINSWFLHVSFVSSGQQSVPVACLEISITSSSQGLYLIRILMSISSDVDQKVYLSKYTREIKDTNNSVKKLDDGPDMTYMRYQEGLSQIR